MTLYPALDVHGVDGELALAVVDQHGPTALEDLDGRVRIFFPSRESRHDAHAELTRVMPRALVAGVDVDDEDWARRSQQSLAPVTVGRITIVPATPDPAGTPSGPQALAGPLIVIQPSMGFGTGHHATTRLCLQALQSFSLAGASVLDVGTGSGVLAIAARMLGARQVVGIDNDPDAVSSAAENLRLNRVDRVRFELADLMTATGPEADVVTANLTGALVRRAARQLLSALPRGGSLVIGGVLAEERDAVIAAFAQAKLVWEAQEEGWAALRFSV